jgi:hypothetical protein
LYKKEYQVREHQIAFHEKLAEMHNLAVVARPMLAAAEMVGHIVVVAENFVVVRIAAQEDSTAGQLVVRLVHSIAEQQVVRQVRPSP